MISCGAARLRCRSVAGIGIFNRSYYEECLVVRVHPEILAKEKIPPALVTKKYLGRTVRGHFRLRALLTRNGTIVLKFFLNISKQEQREALSRSTE